MVTLRNFLAPRGEALLRVSELLGRETNFVLTQLKFDGRKTSFTFAGTVQTIQFSAWDNYCDLHLLCGNCGRNVGALMNPETTVFCMGNCDGKRASLPSGMSIIEYPTFSLGFMGENLTLEEYGVWAAPSLPSVENMLSLELIKLEAWSTVARVVTNWYSLLHIQDPLLGRGWENLLRRAAKEMGER